MASLNLSKLLTPDLARLIMSTATSTAKPSLANSVIVGQAPIATGIKPVSMPVVVASPPSTSDIVAGTNYNPNMTMPADDGGGISRKTLIIGGAAALAIVGAIVVVKLKKKKR